MATNVETIFHDGMEFSSTKLGNSNVGPLPGEKGYTDCLANGFRKSLCYQVLPGIFDFMQSEGEQKDSIVIVVSPLNALIRYRLSSR